LVIYAGMLKFGKQGSTALKQSDLIASDIVQSTARDTGVTVSEVKEAVIQAPSTYYNLNALGRVLMKVYSATSNSGKEYKTIICYGGKEVPGLSGDKTEAPYPSADSPVWVSCSCPYFMFVCEWALAYHGSSDVLYGNGDPPVEKNPRYAPVVCKHLLVALDKSISTAVIPTPEPVTPVPPEEEVVNEDVDTNPEAEVPSPPPEVVPPSPPVAEEISGPDANAEGDHLVEGSVSLSPHRYFRHSLTLRHIAHCLDCE